MQGIILALEALVAAGSQMVGTPQAGKMEVTRHEALRDDDTKEMEDKPAFEKYLKGVRKEGAALSDPCSLCLMLLPALTAPYTHEASAIV